MEGALVAKQASRSRGGSSRGGVSSRGSSKLSGRNAAKSSGSGVECLNCGKKGFNQGECWAKGGGQAGQGPKQGKAGEE